jgi:hypothetical protein
MTDWIYSVTMLVPASVRDGANRLADGLGHGPNNFSVALSADGSEPPTHYGCRAQAQQSFIELLTAAGGGQLLEIEGMTPLEVGTVLMQLKADVSTTEDGYSHFNRVLQANGLQRVVFEE